MEGMWRMLQQAEPEDFVLATGETHPVREYVEKAFAYVGVKLRCAPSVLSPVNVKSDTSPLFLSRWEGTGVDEQGIDEESGRVLVKIDPRYFRPAEVE